MTLETLTQCFSGNTPEVLETRMTKDLLVMERGDVPRFKVTDFTLTTTGQIALIVEKI